MCVWGSALATTPGYPVTEVYIIAHHLCTLLREGGNQPAVKDLANMFYSVFSKHNFRQCLLLL